MPKVFYMIVALNEHFTYAMKPRLSADEKKFQHFVDFRTRRCADIRVETTTPDAVLLSCSDLGFLKHKANVFNQHGYRARILTGNELNQFKSDIMIANGAHDISARIN